MDENVTLPQRGLINAADYFELSSFLQNHMG